MPIRSAYLKPLDGVRAIAALMIMFFHFFVIIAMPGPFHWLPQYAMFGRTGVTLFFVLSGFLISRILLATKTSTRFFINFYSRRALRIFPLYYLFLLITYFLLPPLMHIPSTPAREQVYFWVYLQNIAETFKWPTDGPAHFWSLAIEEHFYLVWPCLIYFLTKRQTKLAIAMMLVIAFGCRLLLIRHGRETFYFTFARMDELALGALLAIWESEGKLKGYSKHFLLGFIVLLPSVVLWVPKTGKFIYFGETITFVQVIKYDLLSVWYFCLVGIVLSLKEGNAIYKILAGRFLSYTGKISYGLYVYHPLCFLLVRSMAHGLRLIPLFLLSCLATYFVATISYYFFEAKFLSLKRYFASDRPLPGGG